MHSDNNDNKTVLADVAAADNQAAGPGIGSRIAPAVALLMLGESAYAQDDDDGVVVPEPSTLALLAAGAVVGGAAKYIHNKRRKK